MRQPFPATPPCTPSLAVIPEALLARAVETARAGGIELSFGTSAFRFMEGRIVAHEPDPAAWRGVAHFVLDEGVVTALEYFLAQFERCPKQPPA